MKANVGYRFVDNVHQFFAELMLLRVVPIRRFVVGKERKVRITNLESRIEKPLENQGF
jgi:hypothetical protein